MQNRYCHALYLLFICLLCLCASGLYGQAIPSYRIEPIELPGDIAGNSVNNLVQDQEGYLWFASRDGLHRYDGFQFKSWHHDPQNPKSLSNSYVEWCLVDKNNNIWVGSYNGGLNLFDRKTETFTRFVHESNRTTSLSNDQVTCMVQDNVGNIWVGTEDGLNRLDPITKRFTRFLHDPKNPKSINANSIKSLLIDHNGILWVGTGNHTSEPEPIEESVGLNRYNPGNSTFTRFSIGEESDRRNSVWALEEDSKGQLWVGTFGNGLYSFDRTSSKFTRQAIDPINWPGKKPGDQADRLFAQISFIHEDQHKKLWIGSFGGGLNLYDPATKRIVAFQQATEVNQKLPNKYCFRICETRDGTIFVSTGGQGKVVFKIRANTERLQNFTFSQHSDVKINYVFQLLENRPDEVLAATGEGFYTYLLHKKEYKPWPPENETRRLRNREVRRLFKERSGQVWVLARNALLKYSAEGRFLSELASKNPTKIRFPSGMLQTKDGSIWITTGFQGLARYLPKNDSLVFFDLPTFPLSKRVQRMLLEDSLKLSRGTFVTSPIEDKSGKIWLAAGLNFTQRALEVNEGGAFFSFDPKTQNINSYWPDNVPRNMLSDLLLDRQGKFWLAIREVGIFKFDAKTAQFEVVKPTGAMGATLGRVNHLEEDAEGHIWMTTSSELIQYDPLLRAFSFFSRNNGLSASNLYQLAKLSHGKFGIGTNNGFYIFDPVQMRKSGTPPELAFTELSVGGEVIAPGSEGILPQPLAQMERLKLNYRSNVFSIGFSTFHYDDPIHNRVQFLLEGYDPDWREVKGEQAAQYVNVPSGHYTFKIRASNAQGMWTLQPRTLKVIITPPWWRTVWAIFLFAFLIAGFAGMFYRWRMTTQRQNLQQRERELQQEREQLDKERRMNERLQQVDKLKDQFLANTSHELRTPLQGIIGLSEALLEEEHDPERKANLTMVVSSGKRLNSLVNDILDFSKLKNADIELDLRPISLHSMADVVLKNISPLVAGKPIELLNSVSLDFPAASADENRLQQILYNLLGNAVKFTESGYIKIDAIERDNDLVVCVEDTGPGIPPDKRDAIFQEFTQGDASTTRAFSGTGLGLSISKRLVELHGGTMWLESEIGQGSKFFFSLRKSTNEGELPVQKVEVSKNKESKGTLRNLLSEVQKVQEETVSTLIGKKEPLAVEQLKNGAALIEIRTSDAPVHILVVDDEPINQQVLKSHLSALKYDITSALNGEDALKALSNGKHFDLVLLDVMMPRMSGYEVCEQIRKKFLPSELPVIMITAKNQVQDLVHGLNTGANDYITKPFTKDEFLARVKTHLNLHQIHAATGRFVPVEFIRALGRESITDVQLGDQIEKEVTVLFSDIRDFTSLSEKMTPEENFRFVNAFHGRLGPIVQTNFGFINQYLGDGIMAIFIQKPEDALKASILMQKNIRAYNLTRLTKGRSLIRTGMGMHTGPLIMGIIGDDKRMDAATISDTVNTASRIESLTKFYGANILISEDSLKGIADKSPFNLRFLGKVLVKGKQHELGIYECIDGDEPEMLWYKQATLEDFAKGVNLYFERDFAGAVEVFKEKVLRRNPRDIAAKILLTKAQNLAETGVPDDWTGVEKMEFK
ncbi:MAG: response regulator [Haliscomenobacter sp.]|nr:two-component regulator propeller domain-containing protein [Haliscomenobacter sp.]MBK9491041.1 response regulator [Haliscomenobacter sp.]